MNAERKIVVVAAFGLVVAAFPAGAGEFCSDLETAFEQFCEVAPRFESINSHIFYSLSRPQESPGPDQDFDRVRPEVCEHSISEKHVAVVSRAGDRCRRAAELAVVLCYRGGYADLPVTRADFRSMVEDDRSCRRPFEVTIGPADVRKLELTTSGYVGGFLLRHEMTASDVLVKGRQFRRTQLHLDPERLASLHRFLAPMRAWRFSDAECDMLADAGAASVVGLRNEIGWFDGASLGWRVETPNGELFQSDRGEGCQGFALGFSVLEIETRVKRLLDLPDRPKPHRAKNEKSWSDFKVGPQDRSVR